MKPKVYGGCGAHRHNIAWALRTLLLLSLCTITCSSLTAAINFKKTIYPVGKDPVSVAFGDFNGDGNLDLAVANFEDSSVSVLLGRKNGTFLPAVKYIVGSHPASVALGDFNLDHKLDLAVASEGNSAVSILLGRENGTFIQQSTTQPVTMFTRLLSEISMVMGNRIW